MPHKGRRNGTNNMMNGCGQKMMMIFYELDEFYYFFDCLLFSFGWIPFLLECKKTNVILIYFWQFILIRIILGTFLCGHFAKKKTCWERLWDYLTRIRITKSSKCVIGEPQVFLLLDFLFHQIFSLKSAKIAKLFSNCNVVQKTKKLLTHLQKLIENCIFR